MPRPKKPLDLPGIRGAIGARVRQAREAAAISQTVLGQQVGYTAPNAISKIEGGRSAALDIARLAAIARALEVELAWLVEPAGKAARGRVR